MRLRASAVVLGAGALLAFAGIAAADEGGGGAPRSVKTTSATINATTKSNVRTSTCTGDDGTYEITRGTYSGSASSSDAALAGSIQIKVKGWLNTSSHLGALSGRFRIDVAGGGESDGNLTAVNNNGTLSGWVQGHSPGGKRLLGTLTGSWDKNAGFTSVQIGGGGTLPNLALLTSGHCNANQD